MARMISPDGKCVGVDVNGRSYNGNVIDVSDRNDRARLKDAGYVEISMGHTDAKGFKCSGCGRHNFFRRCGKCGSDA